MKNAIRFSYVFLESFFKRIIDDGFASDKAIVILGCTQVAAAFSIFNLLVVLGVRLPNPNFGLGIAFLLGLLVVFVNYKMINADRDLESYRNLYREIPKTRKFLGGMTVIALVIFSIVSVILTSKMAVPLRVDPL